MDTITTIQNLLKFNGSAQSVMVSLTPNEIRLIAAAPTQFELIERVYVLLADVRNQWNGRHTEAGQGLLIALRDSVCAVTGREAEDVQDDYGNRAAIARATGKETT